MSLASWAYYELCLLCGCLLDMCGLLWGCLCGSLLCIFGFVGLFVWVFFVCLCFIFICFSTFLLMSLENLLELYLHCMYSRNLWPGFGNYEEHTSGTSGRRNHGMLPAACSRSVLLPPPCSPPLTPVRQHPARQPAAQFSLLWGWTWTYRRYNSR